MTRLSASMATAALAVVALFSSLPDANAQGYPTRPVKIVVPFPTGGTTDIVSRMIAQELSTVFGRTVVVENKPGAGGTTGTALVAKAAPDGYTIVLGNSGALSVGVSLYPDIGYDPLRDLAPISMIADSTVAMVVHPSVPAKDLRELVQLAKQRPGEIKMAIASVGSIHHLLLEQLKLEQGLKTIDVPYKGGGQALIDLLAGTIDVNFDNVPALISYIKAGRMRAVAVASPQRSPVLPDVPSVVEQGMPNLVASPWLP